MGSLSIENLLKQFDDEGETIIAVDDVTLDITDGEFLVLVGPSGCGKSTTLRCIGGLEHVTDGTVYIDGEDVTNRKPMNRNIAMVFQNYALYPHMTAGENMSFGLKMTTALSKEERESKVRDVAEMMGISDLLEKRPNELSGGQQQRVALGRAIVRDPDVFLMDEPLSNLDAKLRTQMRTELQSLQKDLDVTTIYVTHDQTEAMTMADRIAIMRNGTLQQVGTPLECYHKPANQFVAGFIGSPSMNFLQVTLGEDEGTPELIHEEFRHPTTLETSRDGFTSGDDLTLGIRPEDIEIADRESDVTLTVETEVTEPLGDRTFVYFDIGDKRFTGNFSGKHVIEEGQEIPIRFPDDRTYLFDAQTGETIKTCEIPTEDKMPAFV